MARASTSRTAKPARALPPPYQEANHRVAQQAVGRADRPAHEVAAAIRATAGKNAIGAVAAEGAFVGADPRLGRVRRQVAVAQFAVRPQRERHSRLSKQSA